MYVCVGGKGRGAAYSARSAERCFGARAVSNCSESAALTQSRADRVEPNAAERPWVGTERQRERGSPGARSAAGVGEGDSRETPRKGNESILYTLFLDAELEGERRTIARDIARTKKMNAIIIRVYTARREGEIDEE